MQSSYTGYYDGSSFVPYGKVALPLGQEVIITVVEKKTLSLEEKRKNLRNYMNRGPKMFEGDAQDYVNDLRADDRI